MKQVIIIRTDLDMGKGKMVAQGAHASVSALMKCSNDVRDQWLVEGQKKIVLKVGSKQELTDLQKMISRKIPSSLIKDAGLTQLAPGECTALGIGPAEDELIDKFTKQLKLL